MPHNPARAPSLNLPSPRRLLSSPWLSSSRWCPSCSPPPRHRRRPARPGPPSCSSTARSPGRRRGTRSPPRCARTATPRSPSPHPLGHRRRRRDGQGGPRRDPGPQGRRRPLVRRVRHLGRRHRARRRVGLVFTAAFCPMMATRSWASARGMPRPPSWRPVTSSSARTVSPPSRRRTSGTTSRRTSTRSSQRRWLPPDAHRPQHPVRALGPLAWRALPSWYAVSGADRVIDPALQRAMAARARAKASPSTTRVTPAASPTTPRASSSSSSRPRQAGDGHRAVRSIEGHEPVKRGTPPLSSWLASGGEPRRRGPEPTPVARS